MLSKFENLTLQTERVETSFQTQKETTELKTSQNLTVVSESIDEVDRILPAISLVQNELDEVHHKNADLDTFHTNLQAKTMTVQSENLSLENQISSL